MTAAGPEAREMFDFIKKILAGIPKLRKARWTTCGCGKKALDHAWGTPPMEVRKQWKGCVSFGHGAGSCETDGRMRLTTPMPDPKGRCCWSCRDAARARRRAARSL